MGLGGCEKKKKKTSRMKNIKTDDNFTHLSIKRILDEYLGRCMHNEAEI